MKTTKKTAILISSIGISALVAATILWQLTSKPEESSGQEAKPAQTMVAEDGRAPASIAPSTAPVGTIEALPSETTPLTYFQKEVLAYSNLVRKIFPSEADLREKQALFASVEFMKAMGQRLLKPAMDSKSLEEQDLAMDFLFEALGSEQELLAEGLLRDVVVDKQVEDTKLTPKARENLAGLKGEVLYRWTSLRPAETDRLHQSLPGPVSAKVWQNVVEAQSINVAESGLETPENH